jgi:mono/diheme cytochrome c family protein
VLIALNVLLVAALAASQSPAPVDQVKTVWDQVFTADQATRGGRLYLAHCRECHGEDLGGGEGRSLRGDVFWRDWGEDRLAHLFQVIKTEMPQSAPGSLTEPAYVDILAHILAANGLPSGAQELTAERIKGVLIVGKDGPSPPPNFSLVTVSGCLQAGTGSEWILAAATDPVRTRDPDESAVVDAKTAGAGTRIFKLLFVPGGQRLAAGQKASVTGILIKTATDERLNVTSMQALDARCDR